MKLKIVSISFLTLILMSCQPKGDHIGGNPETEEDKTFYAVGAMFGSKLKDLELTEGEVKMVVSGLYDSTLRREEKVDIKSYGPKVQEAFRKRLSRKSGTEKKQGAEYLEKFLKEEGVKKTKSGLAYKIVKEGAGSFPQKTSTVEVHYTGTLIDGTVFDSSRERKKPVSFPLNRVIKGWTEGLQLVREGGTIRLVVPSELAYGDHGALPKIPGGSTLVFDVELLTISKEKSPLSGKKRSSKGKKTKKK